MSLIEEYYELNEAEEVSAIWKGLHIGFYAFAACLGLWCGYTLAILRLRFDDRCYLFTEVKASEVKDEKIDQSNINWQSDTWCDYYQFTMVSSFIVAIIWATFFLMCGKGGKSLTGLPQPWRIVWSSLIFNFIFFLIALSTAIKIQQGTDVFCCRSNFGKIMSKSSAENCDPLKWLLEKDLHITSIQLKIVVKTSWSCACSWFILFLLSLLRIVFVVDFRMYKICVFKIDDTIQNKKEEVLRITNYEEPRQFGKDDRKGMYRTVSEETLEDLEAGNRKKNKVDKKSMRQHFNGTSRTAPRANAAFYVMADLRMLSRDKKRKKSSKVLDEAFARNKTPLGPELPQAVEMPSDFDISTSTSQIAEYIYPYSEEVYVDDEDMDENESGSSSARERPQDWEERSESDDEIYLGNFQENASLRFKKQI